jgi:hypothetical protein
MRKPALPPMPSRPPGQGPFINTPECGFWMVRLARHAPEIPASIGQIDHEPGDPDNKLDTGPIFVANIGLRDVDPLRVWWLMRRRSITEAEHRYQIARLAWLRDYDGEAPELSPTSRVDLLTMPPIGPPK